MHVALPLYIFIDMRAAAFAYLIIVLGCAHKFPKTKSEVRRSSDLPIFMLIDKQYQLLYPLCIVHEMPEPKKVGVYWYTIHDYAMNVIIIMLYTINRFMPIVVISIFGEWKSNLEIYI